MTHRMTRRKSLTNTYNKEHKVIPPTINPSKCPPPHADLPVIPPPPKVPQDWQQRHQLQLLWQLPWKRHRMIRRRKSQQHKSIPPTINPSKCPPHHADLPAIPPPQASNPIGIAAAASATASTGSTASIDDVPASPCQSPCHTSTTTMNDIRKRQPANASKRVSWPQK